MIRIDLLSSLVSTKQITFVILKILRKLSKLEDVVSKLCDPTVLQAVVWGPATG